MMRENNSSLSANRIITVRGAVPADSLGYTDAHSHVWIEPVPGGDPGAPVLNNEAPICAELRDYWAMGGGAIIDCQPPDCGRNANRLRQLSKSSGVQIVACTGFHLRRYYAADHAPLWSKTTQAAADFFIDELRNGMVETRDTDTLVYPGFIKIAAEATLAASPLHLFEAAVAAAQATGRAIEMHSERGAAIEDYLDFFVGQGLEPERLVFCHVDKRDDFGLHRSMAQAGVVLEYDTFYRPKYDPEAKVWSLLPQMIEAGLAANVAIATDMASCELWSRLGAGPGLTAFFTQIRARLVRLGVAPAAIRDLMGGNIAARLALRMALGGEKSQ